MVAAKVQSPESKAQSKTGLRRAGAFEVMRLFSRAAAGRKKLVSAVDAFPWVQAEAQQDCPLEEVCAGKPYRIHRVALFANNLSGHTLPSSKDMRPSSWETDVRHHKPT
jgi:hypothetical protein